MSYSHITTVAYGVVLTPEQMKVLVQVLKKDSRSRFNEVPDAVIEKVKVGRVDYDLYYADVWAQGADGRSSSLQYDPDFAEHVYGIHCGCNETHDIVQVVRNVPEKAVQNYNVYCLPVLARAGVVPVKVPDIILVNQVW